MMNQKNHLLQSLWLAVVVALATGFSAYAKELPQVPFKAAFDTVAESAVEFPIASVHVLGEGNATQLGRTWTETTDQQVNLITGSGTATYRFRTANGDTVEARFVFQTIPLPTQPGVTLTGTWTITGGTGRFVGTAGSGTTEGVVIFTSETAGMGHFTMTGTISSLGRSK